MMIFRYVLLISFAGLTASQALFSASGGAGSARGGGSSSLAKSSSAPVRSFPAYSYEPLNIQATDKSNPLPAPKAAGYKAALAYVEKEILNGPDALPLNNLTVEHLLAINDLLQQPVVAAGEAIEAYEKGFRTKAIEIFQMGNLMKMEAEERLQPLRESIAAKVEPYESLTDLYYSGTLTKLEKAYLEKGYVFLFVPPAGLPAGVAEAVKFIKQVGALIGAENPRAVAAFAAQMHLIFVDLHPFSDGNGTMARILANIVLMSYGYQPLNMISIEEWRGYFLSLRASSKLNNKGVSNLVPFARWFAEMMGSAGEAPGVSVSVGGGVAVVSVVVPCSLCERPKKGECKGCHTQPYCSAACQMIDWPSHKTLCKRK